MDLITASEIGALLKEHNIVADGWVMGVLVTMLKTGTNTADVAELLHCEEATAGSILRALNQQ